MSTKPTYKEFEKRIAELEQQVDHYQNEALKYQTLFSSFPHGITVTDANGNILESNTAAELLLGVSKDDQEKRKIDGQEWRIIRPDGSEMPREEWASVIALKENRQVSNCAMGIVKNNHRTTWLNVTAAPLPLKNKGVIVTYNDITERKQAEDALLESEQKLSSHLQNTPIGAISWDLNYKVIEWNSAAEAIFGYSKTEVMGKHVTELILPEELKEMADDVYRDLISGKGGTNSINENITKDGRRIMCDWYNTILKAANGKVIGAASLVQDITERKQTEDDLIEARDIAQRANFAKSIFLSSMSHELRTPLNAILGFGQILETDKTLNPTQVNYVRKILSGGRLLLVLVSEVLDLALIESGKTELLLESVDCSEVMNECLDHVRSLAEDRGICLDLRPFDPLMRVLADRNRMKQILINLLSNAVKYNSREGTVRIAAVNHEKGVRIMVTDSGPGIPADKLEELFIPFNRLGKEAGAIPGTGIGLAFSKRLAKQMKGNVGLESTGDKGSCFWVELPLIEGYETLSEQKDDDHQSTLFISNNVYHEI